MAKKLAAGSKYVVIDIPYGKTAKVSKKEAKTLKKKFKILAKKFGIKLKVVLTKGNQPIGKSIGPMLELKDILNILDPDKHGPIDLEKKSLFIAGQLLELTGKAKKFGGTSMARDILYSGKALKKFKQIISAQGGSLNRLRTARFHKDILAKKSGKIIEFDNKKINFLARVAGCPNAKSAGIYLHKKLGEKFAKGEPILTIHSESQTRLKEAVKYYFFNKPIKIK
jgi:thymidine phosphorylase